MPVRILFREWHLRGFTFKTALYLIPRGTTSDLFKLQRREMVNQVQVCVTQPCVRKVCLPRFLV